MKMYRRQLSKLPGANKTLYFYVSLMMYKAIIVNNSIN